MIIVKNQMIIVKNQMIIQISAKLSPKITRSSPKITRSSKKSPDHPIELFAHLNSSLIIQKNRMIIQKNRMIIVIYVLIYDGQCVNLNDHAWKSRKQATFFDEQIILVDDQDNFRGIKPILEGSSQF
jgi:hypothetical protein